jgi:hypothetical protein
VLEIPAANGGTIVGSVRDCWQTAIEDVGPAGVDKGKGGKYLILPPNYRETVQDFYTPMASANYQSITVRDGHYPHPGNLLLRSLETSAIPMSIRRMREGSASPTPFSAPSTLDRGSSI